MVHPHSMDNKGYVISFTANSDIQLQVSRNAKQQPLIHLNRPNDL